MTSLTTLRDLKPAEFEQAADGYRAVSSAASATKDRLNDQVMVQVRGELKGEGQVAALSRLERLSKNFHYAQVECSLISAALNGLASELRAAQKRLIAATDDATAAGFKVHDDGSVHWEARPGEVKEDEDLKRKKAQGFADRIGDALGDATKADQKWAPQLERLKAQNDLNVSDKDWADVQGDQSALQKVAAKYLDKDDIPKDMSPQENAKWWKGLSDDERADYTALYPASVGALDGLPADSRDEANRTVLAEKHGQYETALKGIPPEPWKWVNGGPRIGMVQSDEWMDWHKRYGDRKEHLENSLKGMEAIQSRFDATGTNGLPQAYLLGFDADGNGRAIVASGNPDTADHTAVYVPGTTSNLGNIGGGISRADELWRASDAMPGEGAISTITWLGYDAPQSIVKDAPFKHYADDGAPALNSFMDGLYSTNTSDSGGHHTVVSHSYGTTVVGSAARQGDLSADDVVFAGSPGVQVGSSSEIDAPKGHVWNQEADGDAVPDIGRWGHGGSQWRFGGGVGIIPSDELFGANQMTTDTEGHSDYWTPNSQSLNNQAAVISGNYGKVILEE